MSPNAHMRMIRAFSDNATQEKEVNRQALNAILQIGNGCMRLMTPADD